MLLTRDNRKSQCRADKTGLKFPSLKSANHVPEDFVTFNDTSEYSVEHILSAENLPDAWDQAADVYFQKKAFLVHSEKYNPCNLRYYLLYQGNTLCAGAVVYTQTINLLTFLKNIPSPIKFHFIGPPASVSCSGLIGHPPDVDILVRHIYKVEKGLILAVNTPPGYHVDKSVPMIFPPTIAMSHSFKSWDEYYSALRSDYRRRLNKIITSFEGVLVAQTDCSVFTKEMHGLYLAVLDETETKLETLSYEFFKNLPADFILTTYRHNENILAWHINLKDRDKLYFFFGGHNYKFNKQYKSYLNNLNGIIRESLEMGYTDIDLGQTAEIAKVRMGGVPVEKGMFVYHKNRFVRKVFKLTRNMLSYERDIPDANVFKKDIEVNNFSN